MTAIKKTCSGLSLMCLGVLLCGCHALVQQGSAPQDAPRKASAGEAGTPQEMSQEEYQRFERAKQAANDARIAENVAENETGTDPRSFASSWTPFYRYTELENGMIQQELTAAGVVPFTGRLGMFYELPVAQYRDFDDVAGAMPGSDEIGMGDLNLKFIGKPKALEWKYGDDGKKSGSVLLGTEFILPTASEDALGEDSLIFAPILGVVLDMPLHGFIASVNLYEFDVYKKDSARNTSRYVGRHFYMQPLTPPGEWWGGLYLLPEIQTIYDFESDDFSLWVAPEFGKVMAPGRIAYIKPGWGIDNSEMTDRKSTVEVGVRWFF
jgi:hypothetical protein